MNHSSHARSPSVRDGRTRSKGALAALVGVGALTLAACGSANGSSQHPHPHSTSSPGAPASSNSGSASSSSAAHLQSEFVAVVNHVRSSVVEITTSSGLGSGIVYDHRGDIVTNDHVVGSSKRFSVQLIGGGPPRSAHLVGAYPPDDLAVIRVDNLEGLHPASFGNSNALQVGDIVLAIGNPLGLASSVTQGIVSATGRTVVEPLGPGSPGGTITGAIQTSAPINPGNSGGALVDLSGQVVGIPTLAAVDPEIGGQAVGIGFAIPSSTVTTIANQIIRYGKVVNSHRADLGIYGFNATDAAGDPVGVGIQKVMANGPANRAGIPSGSVIEALDGQATPDITALDRVLARLRPGESVTVKIRRPSGKSETVHVKLGTLPGNAS